MAQDPFDTSDITIEGMPDRRPKTAADFLHQMVQSAEDTVSTTVRDLHDAGNAVVNTITRSFNDAKAYANDVTAAWNRLNAIQPKDYSPESLNSYYQARAKASQEFTQQLIPEGSIVEKGVQLIKNAGADIVQTGAEYLQRGKEELGQIGEDISEAKKLVEQETDPLAITAIGTQMQEDKYSQIQQKTGTDIYKLSQDEVKPILGAAAFGNKYAALMYTPFFIDDIMKSVKKEGVASTLRDFTYGQLVDQLKSGNLGERFFDKPVSTTYDVAIAALAPVLMTHGSLKWAKSMEDNIRASAEESKTSPARAFANEVQRNYDLFTDQLNKVRNALFNPKKNEPDLDTSKITIPETAYAKLSTEEPAVPKGTSGGASDFDKWLNGVSTQESGGNYSARNRDSGAYGKFQIMPGNWESWKNEAASAGVDVASGRMSDPAAQEAVARFKLRQYRDRYGDEGALVAWYAGEANGKRWAEGKPDAIGENGHYSWDARQGKNGKDPSIREYVNSAMGHAREGGYEGSYGGGGKISEASKAEEEATAATSAADAAEREAEAADRAQAEGEGLAKEATEGKKQAWEKTSDEMLENALDTDEAYKKVTEADDTKAFDDKTDELIEQHKGIVEDALKKGFDVPDKVLDEYPDLRFKYTGEKEQVTIPAGQYGSIEKPDVVPAQPTTNDFRAVTRPEVNQLINKFVQTYTGGEMQKGVLGTYNPFQDAIRSRAYGDYDTYAHEIAHAIDIRTNLEGADQELIANANKIWGHLKAFQAYPEQVKRAEGIAEFGRQYLLNRYDAQKNFPEFFDKFEQELSRPSKENLKKDIANLSQALRSWYAQSEEARTRGSIRIGRDITAVKKTPKEIVKNAWNKIQQHFINSEEGISRLTKAYIEAGHKFEKAEDNPEILARAANTSTAARTEMLNGSEKLNTQEKINASINSLNREEIYDGAIKHKVTLFQAVQKLDGSELDKKYPDYLKNGNMRNWHEALSTYLVAAADVERHEQKYKNPLERTKAALDIANEKAANAKTKLNEAKLKMRANQSATKELIKKNFAQAQGEVKAVQDLIKENERNLASAKTDSRVIKAKIDGLQAKNAQLNQIYDVLSKRKSEFAEKRSIKIQDKMYKEADVVRLKKELDKSERELQQAKIWAETEESTSDAVAGVVDAAKANRDTIKRAFDKSASEESRIEGTADAISSSITTLSNMEDALIKRSETLEKRIEATKTKNGRAKEAQTSFEQDRDTLRQLLKDTQKNLNAVKRTRQTLEKRNYYRSAADIEEVNIAHKALIKANAEQRKAANQYKYAKQNKYAMNVDFKDADTTFKNAPQEVKDAAEIVYKHADNLISVQEATGLISHELAGIFRQYKYYVPLARDFSETEGMLREARTGRGYINVKYVNKRLKEGGSTRLVTDPILQLYSNTARIVSAGERNRVGQSIGKMADAQGMGNYMIRLPEGTKADEKNGIFTVMVKGHEVAYQTVPEFYEIFKGFNTPTTNVVISFLQPWASALRGGAVGFNPSFLFSNVAVDTFTAAVFNKKLTPVLSTMKGIADQVSPQELQLKMDYMASGANIGGYITLDRNELVGKLDQIAGDGGHIANLNTPEGVRFALNGLRKAVSKYAETAEILENAPRMEAFRKAREEGKTLSEAAVEAKDVTVDFSRSGDWIKSWNRIDPFLNATIQGGDKLRRQLVNYPFTTMANATKWIVLPTIALYAMNYDQDWYKSMPAYVRDNNWVFKIPDTKYVFKLKRPPEMGVIMGASIERALDRYLLSDPRAGKKWLENAANTLLPNLMPTFVQLITGLASNYDTFRNMPIDNFSDLQHLPQNRYNAYTSGLAKGVGEITGTSPKKIDFAIRTLFGGAGTFLSQAPDKIMRENSMPDKGLADIPILSRFIVNTEFSSSTEINDFYNNYTAIKMKHKDGQYPRSITGLNHIYKKMSKLSKDNRETLADKTKSKEQKTAIIVKNIAEMREIAKKANKEYPLIDF